MTEAANRSTIPITVDSPLRQEYVYALNTLGRHHGHSFELVAGDGVVHLGDNGVRLSRQFAEKYEAGVRDPTAYFADRPVIYVEDGRIDHLSTAFYLMSCVQEWANTSRDRYGRFPYRGSVQERFGTVRDDSVSRHYAAFLAEAGLANRLQLRRSRSRVLLSHDIDSLAGSTRNQVLFATKRSDIAGLGRSLLSALMHRNDKSDLDRIMRWEELQDLRSTFFWLTESGRVDEIDHADYEVSSAPVRALIQDVRSRGFSNALHKAAFDSSLDEELGRLPVDAIANRFHFLKFDAPDAFPEIDASRIKVDASLGYAEEMGFRNNYALPFRPYDHGARCQLSFIEVPLHIMDTTFIYYMRREPRKALESIVGFLESHRYDAVISILFHNEYLTEGVFGPWVRVYRDLLLYLRENSWTSVQPEELLATYY